jgi:hypothetical protein
MNPITSSTSLDGEAAVVQFVNETQKLLRNVTVCSPFWRLFKFVRRVNIT